MSAPALVVNSAERRPAKTSAKGIAARRAESGSDVMSVNMDRAFAAFRRRGGDEDLSALLNACRPRAVGFCCRVLGNRDDAEDVAQRVLLEVARHASEIANAACFRSWFFRVCRARSADYHRGRTRRASHEALAAGPVLSNGNGHPDDDARRLLFAALAELPETDRALVVDHYFEKQSLSALGRRQGCTKVAVWKRLERIRAWLQRRLSGTGLALLLPNWDLSLSESPILRTPRHPRASMRPMALPAAARSRASLWTAVSAAGFLVFTLGMTAGVTLKRSPPVTARSVPTVARPVAVTKTIPASNPAPVEIAPPPATASKKSAEVERDELKELVRQLFRQIQAQRKTGQPISPELSLELAPLNDITRVAHRDPARGSERFAGFVSLLYEVAAEENGFAFSPEARARLERLRENLAAALGRAPAGPAPVRLLAAVEADLAFAKAAAGLVPQDQAGLMMLSDIDRILKRGKRKSMTEERLLREVLSDWTAAIPAEAGAHPLLEVAAGRLVATLGRLTEDFRRLGESYDEDDYSKNMLDRAPVRPYDPVRRMEYQVEALKAQIEALSFVRDGLNSSQGSRLAEAEPWNYAVSRKGVLIEMRD